ncbi:transglycosylase SLT domain-containing protein [Kitasatospora sp. MMS16-BH015]|uniref:aggregation-promoting factor C-terminal-like domain-containing protein n=1 Tax=Kitasatospora sp. MMS16-BH015 TaxID=2018025 RepID=UPI0015805C56|nr:transglycosylase SLT domain-containing protein [Kitasatospora sp. MMS16-BH015]
MLEGNHVTRISVRGVAVASATAVTAVGAVVGVASGSEGSQAQTVDVAGATLLADVPMGAHAQTVSDNFSAQANAQQVSADAAAKKAAEEAARQKAAADAQAKADAEKAAKAADEKRKADEEAANRAKARSALVADTTSYSPGSVQALAAGIIGDDSQFQCFSQIVKRESGWDYTATNSGSGAYGLVQALPGSKMSSVGSDWRTNPATQIKWGLGYMNDRYGSPCGAWSFWQSHHWY